MPAPKCRVVAPCGGAVWPGAVQPEPLTGPPKGIKSDGPPSPYLCKLSFPPTTHNYNYTQPPCASLSSLRCPSSCSPSPSSPTRVRLSSAATSSRPTPGEYCVVVSTAQSHAHRPLPAGQQRRGQLRQRRTEHRLFMLLPWCVEKLAADSLVLTTICLGVRRIQQPVRVQRWRVDLSWRLCAPRQGEGA